MRTIAEQRRSVIRRELALWGAIGTQELVQRLAVTERTVQRDMDRVAEESPGVRRVHGGLVAVSPLAATPPLRIGLLVPSARYYYAEVIDGAKDAAAALGARLIVGTYSHSEALEDAALRRLGDVRLDGVIAAVDYDSGGYDRLTELRMPAVVVERPLHPNRIRPEEDLGEGPGGIGRHVIDHVCSDHVAGAQLGLHYLAGLGHRRIACLIRATPTSIALLRGIDVASRELVPQCSVTVTQIPTDPHTRQPPPECWQEAVRTLIGQCRSGEITAVLVHHDWDALQLYRELTEAGIAVPDQVSLLEYDGVLTGAERELSAITPRRRWIGALAVETVVDRLHHHGRYSHGRRPGCQISLVPELIVRDSTASPG